MKIWFKYISYLPQEVSHKQNLEKFYYAKSNTNIKKTFYFYCIQCLYTVKRRAKKNTLSWETTNVAKQTVTKATQ